MDCSVEVTLETPQFVTETEEHTTMAACQNTLFTFALLLCALPFAACTCHAAIALVSMYVDIAWCAIAVSLDKADALAAYRNQTSCQDPFICDDSVAATLCSQTCGRAGVKCALSDTFGSWSPFLVDACSDNDSVLNTYWVAAVSQSDGIMTCPRARAALACSNAVVKELCAATCLACHDNTHPGTRSD